MVLIFCIATAAACLPRLSTDGFYEGWIKPEVDFINAHLGIGFPVPIIMLNHGHRLVGSRDIARIIGVFAVTNGVAWVFLFILSVSMLLILARIVPMDCVESVPSKPNAPSTFAGAHRETKSDSKGGSKGVCSLHLPSPSDSSHQTADAVGEVSGKRALASSVWRSLEENFAIILFLLGIFAIGVPISVCLHDERIVDAFSMCLIWISSVKAQRSLKASPVTKNGLWPRKALAIMLNPVLITIVAMIAYTRMRALAFGKDGLARVLESFSSGTPLYSLWTAAASSTGLAGDSAGRFGAGDAGLAVLECGILIWGFKLFECRRQIFGIAGLVTIFICTAAAAGNVYLSVLLAREVGLRTPETLSFAARSTTLALAKPAMEAVGGNIAVNATLVVSNGVLGQLMLPLILGWLGVAGETAACRQLDEPGRPCASPRKENRVLRGIYKVGNINGKGDEEGDGPVTIATGIAIGVNGAAMGVSYLYEARSRAAPYAALSMTVFGVMTVVFTTVEPFKGILTRLSIH